MIARRLRFAPIAALVAVLVAGCSSGPILANPVAGHIAPAPTPTASPMLPDPRPVAFPVDDGPHRRLTEWWYYTGHLQTDDGRQFGFEFVVFRAERGAFPVSWASHLALTDEQGRQFSYGQRAEIGPQVDVSPRGPDGSPTSFALSVSGSNPGASPSSASSAESAWTMRGALGHDHLVAALSAGAPDAGAGAASFGLDLVLASNAPPVLHDRVGYVSFGPAGGSYYYSRPRMAASGTLQLGGQALHVTGEAWFDHQWGDFISVGGGGWDWFAVNLANGTDLTLSLVRDATGGYPLVYGTLVHPDGSYEHLDAGAFSVDALAGWTSPTTGTAYPAGWRVRVPAAGLELTLTPTVPDQELDTRATTGVVYWEGSQHVVATHNGQPVAGEAYVELTGYAKSSTNRP